MRLDGPWCPDRRFRPYGLALIYYHTLAPAMRAGSVFAGEITVSAARKARAGPARERSLRLFPARGERQAHRVHEQLEVFPRVLLGGRVAQKIGRVVGDERGNAPVAVPLPAEPAHAERGFQQALDGGPAQQAEELGTDDLDLALEIRQAVGRLLGRGLAVLGRAALEDVGDVDVLAACRPIPLVIMSVSNWPARPTNGRPIRSSSAPGASPMNISRAVGLPSPKTVWVRVSARTVHFRQPATSSARACNTASRSSMGMGGESKPGSSNSEPAG